MKWPSTKSEKEATHHNIQVASATFCICGGVKAKADNTMLSWLPYFSAVSYLAYFTLVN